MPPAVAAPDWQSVTDDVACTRCGYNLRGLTQPRCPECGLEFEWADLLDPARRRHPYLFEHQARYGRFESFVRTAVGALNPWRFWRTITLQQPCNSRRLWWFWLIVLALYAAVCGGITSLVLSVPGMTTRLGGPTQIVVALTLPLLLQTSTIGALLVFQQTLSRWRIRSYHVTRTAVYAGVGLHLGMAFAVLAQMIVRLQGWVTTVPPNSPLWTVASAILMVVVVVAPLHWWASLWCAYRRYLKIRHCLAMLVASQVIAALVVINLLAQVL